MTQPWPTDPSKKAQLIRQLKNKYQQLFGTKHLETDMKILDPPLKPSSKEDLN